MKILKIALANIKKRKSASITFFIITMIATFMLAISLTLFSSISSFYDNKSEDLKGGHLTLMMPESYYEEDIIDFINDYKDTEAVVKAKAYYGDVTFQFKNSNVQGNTEVFDQNEFLNSSVNPLKLIDKLSSQPSNGIIIPLVLKSHGVEAGDDINFVSYGKRYTYKIYAFFEDIEFGGSTNSMKKIFVPTEIYNSFENDNLFTAYTYISVRLNNHNKVNELNRELTERFEVLNSMGVFSISYEEAKQSSTTFVNIISAILLLFSIILLFIALIVVRFNIITSISEDMKSIGSLKSIGYSSKQIIFAQTIQFLLISFIGSIVGMIFAIIGFGTIIGNVIASTSGILWTNSTNILPMISSVLLICLLTTGITYFLARKTRQVTPINALRQGDSHHSFKKNHLPLSKHKMPLNIHLGFKRLLNNLKNNIVITLVVSLLCLVTSIVFVVKYNMIDKPQPFYDMVGMELSDVYLACTSKEDVDNISNDYNDKIKYVLRFENPSITVEGVKAQGNILEDFSYSTAKDIYKGRNPILDNEIVIGLSISKSIKKGIGDTVTAKIAGVSYNYIVVGISQGLSSGGSDCSLTLAGVRKMQPTLELTAMAIYLKDNITNEEFINLVKNDYGSHIAIALDVDIQLDTIFSSMANPIEIVTYAMIVLTIIVIGFVLFLLINSMIRREKKTFGIMKALGYSNKQLIIQIVISFTPALFLGVLIGALISTIFANSLLSLMFGMAGIGKTIFIIPGLQVVGLSLLILAFALLTIYLVSLKIRNVSPQKLIISL